MLEPWGMEPAALNAAMVSCTLANIHRASNTAAYAPGDFLPVYGLPKPRVEPTAEERSDQIRQLLTLKL